MLDEVQFTSCGHIGFSKLPAPKNCPDCTAEKAAKLVEDITEDILEWFLGITDPTRPRSKKAVKAILLAYKDNFKIF